MKSMSMHPHARVWQYIPAYSAARLTDQSKRNDATCTACAGTMLMEFAALSRYSGDPKYEVDGQMERVCCSDSRGVFS